MTTLRRIRTDCVVLHGKVSIPCSTTTTVRHVVQRKQHKFTTPNLPYSLKRQRQKDASQQSSYVHSGNNWTKNHNWTKHYPLESYNYKSIGVGTMGVRGYRRVKRIKHASRSGTYKSCTPMTVCRTSELSTQSVSEILYQTQRIMRIQHGFGEISGGG